MPSVALVVLVACATPPRGKRPETVAQPDQCFQRCSEPGITGQRSCETFCEPQLDAIRWVPDCETQCAGVHGAENESCVSSCKRPRRICGNAPRERGPVFKAVFVTLAVIGASATGALAIHQATDR